MVKKILKYFLMVASLTIFLILILVIKPATEDSNKKYNTQESETVEEQLLDVLSVDETDENIIGYISIEKIG